MNFYYQMKAILPTTIKGGVRKVTIEIMPDYMSFHDAVYGHGMILMTNEQGYQKEYDSRTARELFFEIYTKAIKFEYILLFQKKIR